MAKRKKRRTTRPYQRQSIGIRHQNQRGKVSQSATALSQVSASSSVKSTLGLFAKFGGLSGLGWLADFCILLLLVSRANIPADRANLVSAGIAASSVFLISREKIFVKAKGWLLLRLVAYLGYTIIVIMIASQIIKLLVPDIRVLAASFNLTLTYALATAVAKIVVTPPTLILNFLVSRLLSEIYSKRKNYV